MPSYEGGRMNRGGRNARGRGSTGRGNRGRSFPRGRAGLVNRGAGRGKRGFQKFHSTRVEQATEGEDGVSSSPEESSAEESAGSKFDSSEDEQEAPLVRPYDALLQSLNSQIQRGEPLPKKRKFEAYNEPRVGPKLSEAKDEVDIAGDGDIDLVDEQAEDESLSSDELGDLEDTNDIEKSSLDEDVFEKHFVSVKEENLKLSIEDIAAMKWQIQRNNFDPQWKAASFYTSSSKEQMQPNLSSIHSIDELQLKQKLEHNALQILPAFDGLNGYLAATIFDYNDLLFTDRTPERAEQLRSFVCLHALNHIFKTRDRVIKNNDRLAKSEALDDAEYRDQGFTRPKVLILLPTRQSCVRAVETILSLWVPEQQENKKRFQDAYTQGEENFSDDKPSDFRELFSGNDDDLFRLGLKFTRKTVKFFSQFYNSDIIFASPLGLRMAIGTEESKKQDHDFLSSIEIVIVDQADALLMQNWEHVEYIFEHLNLQPKETHGCDFSRVRHWYLDGHAKYFRQNIILSAFNTPELNQLFARSMFNVFGKKKISLSTYEGAMLDMQIAVKQTFSRFDAPTLIDDPDARFKYFTTAIVPMLTKYSKTGSRRGQGVLIFVPSYMDFVRVRNFLANSSTTENISFGSISEYTSVRDVARARSHFFSGRHSVLLYTGRAHHFRRYHLRGTKKVILYALPENSLFYQEIAGGFLASSIAEGELDSGEASIRTLFSKWDALKLERIVGTKRFVSMLTERGGDTFDFL